MSGETATVGEDSGLAIDPYRVALYATLVGVILAYLVPLEAGLITAFKTSPNGIANTLPFLPSIEFFSLQAWTEAFDALSVGLVNSALYAVPATIISALLGSITAYGLTQPNWSTRLKAFVMAIFVSGIFIPYQAVLVPLSRFWGNYVVLRDLLPWAAFGVDPVYHGIIEMIVTHVAYGLPICTLLFRSYYKNMDEEMIESARLDGASLRRVYRRIVLPLSRPMFAVVLIYQFTQIWNDLLFALILISSGDAAPAVLILSGLGLSQSGINFPLQMAGAFITAIPTLAVYILFGEEFAEGVAT
jgi:glucose/mannose transport system permease protein